MLRVNRPNTEINQVHYYRAVSFGETLATTPTRSMTLSGLSLKPLPVTNTWATRHEPATNDWSIFFRRRGRIDWDWRDYADVPLGETTESYEVDIINTSTGAVVRTLSSSTQTVVYTAAQQTTDFGSAQANIRVRIYQLSSAVGRGIEKEVSFP